MPKPKGGRGHAAPYDTKLMRVPVPLADQVQQLIERYQDFIAGGGEAYAPPPLLDAIASDNPVNNFDELKAEVEELRGQNNFQQNRWELTERHNNGLAKECQALELQLEQLKLEHDQLDHEVNELHQKNGDLNLQVEILRQQLKDAANPVNEFELKEALASADYWEAIAKDFGKQADKLVNKLSVSKEIENPTQEIDIKVVNNLQPLSQRQLGKRLGISHTAIGKKQKLTIFTDWARQRDPEGIAWKYDEQSKLFQPLKLQ